MKKRNKQRLKVSANEDAFTGYNYFLHDIPDEFKAEYIEILSQPAKTKLTPDGKPVEEIQKELETLQRKIKISKIISEDE
jgi:hypothetical protein